MSEHDEAFERLRAADPATGATPDIDAIGAVVAAATGVPVAGEAVPVIPRDELAARRHRTRTRWFQVAAAVVGVAVVGTGGYLAGGAWGTGGGGATTAGGALPPITLNGAGSSGSGASTATEERAAAPMAAGASDMAMGTFMPGGWYGRTVFSDGGLSTAGGTATAYGFDATAVGSADAAARIAAAFGVAGDPRVEWGSWVVGPNDGSGPTVSVYGSGTVDFNYYDPTRDPWQCGQSGAGSVGGATGEVAPMVEPSPAESQPAPAASDEPAAPVETAASPDEQAAADDAAKAKEEAAAAGLVAPSAEVWTAPTPAPGVCDAGTTPTGDAATTKARDALAAAGIDVSTAQVSVDDSAAKSGDTPGAAYVNVSFQQVVDGQLTGYGWYVSLVGDGVQSASGPLAPLVSLGSYEVISPAQAVQRLNDPRFGSSGGIVAYAADAGGVATAVPEIAVAPDDPAGQQPTIPPAPTAGAAISWPVANVTLTSARLGLASATTVDGAQVLVPAYELGDDSGTVWSVVAVVDAQLDFTVQQ